MEELLTAQEVAAELRLDEQTVRKYLRGGQLQGFKVGGQTTARHHWRITREEVEAFKKCYGPDVGEVAS